MTIRCCALLLLALCACNERPSPGQQRADALVREPAAPNNGFYTPEGVQRVFEDIRSRAGADASLLELELLPDRATVQVQPSGRAGHVEQYEWRQDGVQGPVAVELRGKGKLEQNLFPLSALDLSGIVELVSVATERVDPDNGRVRRVLVRRGLPADDAICVRVYVDSPLRSGHVDADARGKLVEPATTKR